MCVCGGGGGGGAIFILQCLHMNIMTTFPGGRDCGQGGESKYSPLPPPLPSGPSPFPPYEPAGGRREEALSLPSQILKAAVLFPLTACSLPIQTTAITITTLVQVVRKLLWGKEAEHEILKLGGGGDEITCTCIYHSVLSACMCHDNFPGGARLWLGGKCHPK